MNRLVIAAGMRRSGSTLQYQLICDVLEMAGITHSASWVDEVDEQFITDTMAADGVKVIKTHKVANVAEATLSRNGVEIFYASRDPRDAVSSYLRKYGKPFSPVAADKVMGLMESEFRFWTSKPIKRWTHYESMVADLSKETASIADALGVMLNEGQINSIGEKRSIQKQKALIETINWSDRGRKIGVDLVDSESLLHSNHIYSGAVEGWREFLKSGDIRYLERRYGKFIRDAGYRLDSTLVVRWADRLVTGLLRRGSRLIRQIRGG